MFQNVGYRPTVYKTGPLSYMDRTTYLLAIENPEKDTNSYSQYQVKCIVMYLIK